MQLVNDRPQLAEPIQLEPDAVVHGSVQRQGADAGLRLFLDVVHQINHGFAKLCVNGEGGRVTEPPLDVKLGKLKELAHRRVPDVDHLFHQRRQRDWGSPRARHAQRPPKFFGGGARDSCLRVLREADDTVLC